MNTKPPTSPKSVQFDPSTQPWVVANTLQHPDGSSSLLPALHSQDFNRDLIDQIFNAGFIWHEDVNVRQWNYDKRHSGNLGRYIQAAVLIPLVINAQGQTEVLLTLRSKRLKNHSGQISFPGGRVESTDLSNQEAAIRETYEEVGVAKENIEIFGQMPEFLTGTGFVIKPYIAYIKPTQAYTIDPNEVEKTILVPLDYILDPNNHRYYSTELGPKLIQHYYGIEWQDAEGNRFLIWGATAAILRNLYQRLRQGMAQQQIHNAP
ncbi:NUDIX hydrolase [Brackiella oedipodis]|uniref:NUDIX hydrolase n=1 Tax=Brackiella oedipodis TaxID=124225 RepID=UPI00146FA953|nr:CoA pyrophosphatase [Brackiella oedipodis]